MPSVDLAPSFTSFELRFARLAAPGRAFAFPCDSCGNVDIDQLPDTLRTSYLFARASVGFELYHPVVCPRNSR